jgi:hypothetical protein
MPHSFAKIADERGIILRHHLTQDEKLPRYEFGLEAEPGLAGLCRWPRGRHLWPVSSWRLVNCHRVDKIGQLVRG